MSSNCFFCYGPLEVDEIDFHAACSRRMFGTARPPLLPYTEHDLESLAKEVVMSSISVTGVQPKISLHLSSGKGREQAGRFTIVGLWGGYILKPPTPLYPLLPEVEDLTMHLAALAGIKVVPHSLLRMESGSLPYITQRIDRSGSGKIAMEDMCQLTERLTEDKYHGSYEQVGKAILRYSANPVLDTVNFMELVLFSYLTGNADMHLKNFSLIHQGGLGMVLSPAYDLLNTALVNPADKEQMALTLNGRKNCIHRLDFHMLATRLGISGAQEANIFTKMEESLPRWHTMVDMSFLSAAFKVSYRNLLDERSAILRD
jgi:serine/threonine-protein kinase HipA